MEEKLIYGYVLSERRRKKNTLTLIASENCIYPDIIKSFRSSCSLSDKYSEGYPGKRFYAGCKYIDKLELSAISAATQLFGCKYANVQCYSGSIANLAIYKALINPGDTILSMDMSAGGHLTHSSKYSFVTYYYRVETYGIDPETYRIDYEEVRRKALETKPKLIVAGSSSYPFSIDFKKFREIADEVGAYLFADICHFSGLIAANLHNHCFPHAHVAMCTTHKQLRGYRGALILWNDDELSTKINKSVFPGLQGGMNPEAIAINAACLTRNLKPEYKEYMKKVVKNAQLMSSRFRELKVKIIGTETHMLLIDTKASFDLTGIQASNLLEKAGYIVNANLLPFDELSPSVTSGIRIGTLYLSTLDISEQDVLWIVDEIYKCLKNKDSQTLRDAKKDLRTLLNKI